MGTFRHPHLTRGIVHIAHGSFSISRGVVIVPNEVGEAYGWQRLDAHDRDSPPSAIAVRRGETSP